MGVFLNVCLLTCQLLMAPACVLVAFTATSAILHFFFSPALIASVLPPANFTITLRTPAIQIVRQEYALPALIPPTLSGIRLPNNASMMVVVAKARILMVLAKTGGSPMALVAVGGAM